MLQLIEACEGLKKELNEKNVQIEKLTETKKTLSDNPEEYFLNYDHMRKNYSFEELSLIYSELVMRQKVQVDELKKDNKILKEELCKKTKEEQKMKNEKEEVKPINAFFRPEIKKNSCLFQYDSMNQKSLHEKKIEPKEFSFNVKVKGLEQLSPRDDLKNMCKVPSSLTRTFKDRFDKK